MTTPYDHGPLQTWQVIWRSGHVEEIRGHQCLLPSPNYFFREEGPRENRLTFHGEIDGHWKLVLDVDYAEILSVRLLTGPEAVRPDVPQ
jgi:hypothetical protein